MTMTLGRIPALDSWMTQQPRELNVEVQARLRRGMRLDTVCILSTSPIDSKFTDLPQSVIEDVEAVMHEKMPEIEPGDSLEITVKRTNGTITQTVTTDFTRSRAAQDSAIEEQRRALSQKPFGAAFASRVTRKLEEGATLGMQYDPRDGGAIGFWRDPNGDFCRGDLNVDQPRRHARARHTTAGEFEVWLAAQSDRSLFDTGFGITREQLERSVKAGDVR